MEDRSIGCLIKQNTVTIRTKVEEYEGVWFNLPEAFRTENLCKLIEFTACVVDPKKDSQEPELTWQCKNCGHGNGSFRGHCGECDLPKGWKK